MLISAAMVASLFCIGMFFSANAKGDTYGDLFYWTDWMAKKYGVQIYVAEEGLPPHIYGISQGNTIVYNSYYTANPAELHASMSQDVADGYHPGKYCTATQIVAVHESAHVIDWYNGRSGEAELRAAVAGGMSGYVSAYSFNSDGSINYGEALADAMVAVECDDPTDAEVAMWEMLVY
jgi:hypothetical protein